MRNRFLTSLVALVLLAAACSSDSSSTGGPSTTGTTAVETPSVDPELVDRVEEELADWMAGAETPVPGATLSILLPDGEAIHVASGVADLKTEEPVTPESYFRIGSVTKTITTAVVLQLVAEGEVELDAPVAQYLGDDWITGYELDGVDQAGEVTVRDLLSHTDGFAEFAWDIGFYLQTAERLDQPYEPQELLDWGAAQGPLFAPGTDYSYNTVGHVAAGLIIEEVTGNSVDVEFENRIFGPLDLEHTFMPPGTNPPEEVVHAYAVGDLRAALESLPQADQYRELGIAGDDDEYFDMLALPQEAIASAGWTGGGIEARAADIATIFRAMFDGTLLDEASIEQFTTPNDFSDYALGLSVGETLGHTAYEHGGGVPGFRSHAAYYPELDIAIFVSANAVPVDPDVGVLVEDLLAIVDGDAG